jgi:hypothetical protein
LRRKPLTPGPSPFGRGERISPLPKGEGPGVRGLPPVVEASRSSSDDL